MKYIQSIKYTFSMLIAVLFLASGLYAQQGERLLKDVQDSFSRINDMTASFSQYSGSNGQGKLFYKKGNKYRIEMKNVTIASDGETVWNYNKKNNKVVVNDVRDENSPFSLENIIINYPKKSTAESAGSEKIDGVDYSVLKLNSKNDRRFKTAKIWFERNNFIRKVEVTDASGTKYGFQLSDVQINKNVSSDKFSFQIPEGTDVVDLR